MSFTNQSPRTGNLRQDIVYIKEIGYIVVRSNIIIDYLHFSEKLNANCIIAKLNYLTVPHHTVEAKCYFARNITITEALFVK